MTNTVKPSSMRSLLLIALFLAINTLYGQDTIGRADTCEIFIANVITPSCNGSSDMLVHSKCALDDFQINIYDRWGTLLFTSADLNEMWQPDYNAHGDDTFYWVLRALKPDGQEVNMKGTLTVLY